MIEASSKIETRHQPHWSDWWILGVLPLAILHLTLFLTLQARPGQIALVLWQWGPPALVTATAALLGVALVSAVRSRLTWNPRRAAALACVCALVGTMGIYQTFPSAYDRQPSTADVRLPLDGPVTVVWGGPTAAMNYHVSSPAERWAYDLLTTRDGRSHRGNGRSVTDYYAHGLPVRAPAAGRVVEVHDADPDVPPGHPDRTRGGGNRIVFEIGPRQYLVVAHLLAGSIRVVPGERICQGDIVGRVGNSGNSSEPHVHLHLQDTPLGSSSQGIPFYFSHYRVVGSGATQTRGMPRGGVKRKQFVGDIITSIGPGDDPQCRG